MFAVGDVIELEGARYVITTKTQKVPKLIDRAEEIAGELDDFLNGNRTLRLLKVDNSNAGWMG